MTDFSGILGGVGLFLLGMWLMTGGLKTAAGDALRGFIERWTKTRLRGLGAGILVTALVQSSSAVTVAVIGFVSAGLMSLRQAVWVVFGTNVGTTLTGWLVALVGVKVDVGALALPLIGVGMLARLAVRKNERRKAAADALTGFGVFFLGVGVLQEAFADVAPAIAAFDLASAGPLAIIGFVGIGALLTVLTQSSSAAIAITLTASAGAAVPLPLAAAAVIGANLGTTSTAVFAAIGATPAARRVAAAHIFFNLTTAAAALALLPLLLPASVFLAEPLASGGETASLAMFHTIFNALGVLLMWPVAGALVQRLDRMFVTPEEAESKPRHLDASLAQVPALALNGLVLETQRMIRMACALAAKTVGRAPVMTLDVARHQNATYRLGASIRDFINMLTQAPLPPDVVNAIPDIVRAVQHAEETASDSAGGTSIALPQDAAIQDEWTRLEAAVQATLALENVVLPARPELTIAEAEVENAYQAVKAALLTAAARRVMTVSAMEAALREAQRRRRISRAAAKAMRRLTRWVSSVAASAAGEGAPPPAQEGEPAPAAL